MDRLVLAPLLALLALAPAALAHDPPGPVTACGPATERHDYLGFGDRRARPVTRDGCGSAFDGDLDHGFGGAVLFVEEQGAQACYGPLASAHHSNVVRAQDALGFGPMFTVRSDHSRLPPLDGVDCGDGYLEPCIRVIPIADHPFPLSLVMDEFYKAYYALFGPGGAACNDLEYEARFAPDASGPSGGVVPIAPGPDGSYVVIIEADLDNAHVPTGGHVWTE